MKVGVLASLNTMQMQLTYFGLTALFATFGAATLAGFGAANRMELLQVPVTFGVGTAMIAMIATCHGAGLHERVSRVAWAGSWISAGIGLVFAALSIVWPEHWMAAFSDEPAVIEAGAIYLRVVGLAFPFLGFALGLFFALLGAGQAIWAFLAGTIRMAVTLGVGAAAVTWLDAGPFGLALVAVFAALVFSASMILSGRRLLWPRPAPVSE